MLRISRRKTLLSGLLKDGLYPIPRGFSPPSSHGGSQCFASISHSISTWHSQVGHPSASVLKSFAPSLSLPTKSLNDFFFLHCPFGKSKKLPFNLVNEPPPHSLHTIYFGVWDPSPTNSVDGYHHYVIFVNGFTRFTWFLPLFQKLMLVLSSLIFKHWLKIYLTERSSFFKVMAAVTLLTTHSYTISKVWDTTSHFVSLYAGTKWRCRTQTPAYCGDRAHITSWK